MKRPAPLALTSLLADKRPDGDGFVRLNASEREWICLALGCAAGLQDLLALWTEGNQVRMALGAIKEGVRAIVSHPIKKGQYPSVGVNHAPALRIERAIRDLKGPKAAGNPDPRGWIDHGKWPARRIDAKRPRAASAYSFLPVEGVGLHQIPVGPVHAGIIEPGHFRFTANGEAVVRLEERLGYVHRGVEELVRGRSLAEAAALAARISGDSTVAWSLAFARAVEAAMGWKVPRRAILLRAVMAELERIANHIGDFGAVCNDASVIVIQAQSMLLREGLLQMTGKTFGHRLMMDRVLPGGVAVDAQPDDLGALDAALSRLATDFERVVHVYDEAPSLQDRTVTTGIVKPELAARFAAGGHVGRASGRACDTRATYPYAPYGEVVFAPALLSAGDVDARLWVRVAEVRSSVDLVRQLIHLLEAGPIHAPMPRARAGEAASMVESFRGDVFVAVKLADDGTVADVHFRDPSVFQWPLLEAAIEGNIVADFPLCNKSFNCSYAGHDL